MDLRLTISVPGHAPADQLLVAGTTYSLGRSTACDIVIPSAYVSRTPIRVEWTGFGFDIVDTANRNPIVINGYPMTGRGTINSGDLITIGDVTIAVQAVVEPESAAAHVAGATVAPGQPAAAPPPDATQMPPMAAPAAPVSSPQPVATPAAAAAAAPAAAPQAPAAPPRPAGADYGTLRVRTADGGLTEYSIHSRTVVVGRASGVGITIEDDVSVDRRHFQLRIEDGRVTIEDLGSAGGTFLEGQRLQPNTIHRLAERQIIRFGNCEAELLPPSTTAGGAAAKERAPTLTVSLAPPTTPIAAGGTGTATVTIHNRGKVVDQISLRVPDLDPGWVEVRRPTVSLVPGARDEVTIVFKPPKTAKAVAGEHPFAVAAVSATSGTEVRALGRFTILPFESFDFSCRPRGRKGKFALIARNNGNAPSTHVLTGMDEEEGLNFNFETERAELGPGEEKTIQLAVKPKRRNPFGQNKNYRFTVEARPEGSGTARAVANGAYVYRAPFRRWKMWATPLLAALGLGTVMIFARGNLPEIIRWLTPDNKPRPAATQTARPTGQPTQPPATTAGGTAPPATPSPAVSCEALGVGCDALVINSPLATGNDPRSCLNLRSAPTTASGSSIILKLCDGDRVKVIGGPTEADGFRWWQVQTGTNVQGFVAERRLNASGDPRDVGPWIEVAR
jgi:pSer/pThr/pTyr-binding forkhead associated (FHA) protein